jgi:signal transduction histidine kinase
VEGVVLVRSIFDIYFSRDIVELKKVCPALAKPLCAHWCGDFTNSDVDYSFAFNNAHFSLGSAEHQLAIADQLLVRVKIGNPFPENFDFDTLVDPSARLIAYYARFYWGFWTNHTLARQSIRRIAMLAVRLKRYDILLTATFLLGHLSVIRSGSRVGYQIAAAAHFLMLRFVNRQGWINDFSKNVVFASFSYTQFVSGRIASTKIERSIEIGETLVAKSDPYYQSLLLISGLYGYAYGGNIAKTEIFSQKFQELHREGKMVRYAYVSSMMRLLPFALRGYSHLIEEEYLDLLGKFENQTSDPLIRSQFYRAAAVISLILGNNTRTLSFIVMARRERIKTRSFIAWEKFDRNIERLAKRSVPFDLAKDTLSNIAMPGKTLPHLGTILFKLMAITPVALEQGELWLEYQIKDLLCAHLGIHDVLVSRNKNQPFSSRPVIQIGNLRVEFLNIPESQILFMREVLSSLSAGVESYIRTYRKLVEARQIEKEAYLANRLKEQAEQVAHDIRSPLSALNMVMKSANSLPEEQRLIIRSATRRINDIANGLLKSSKASERIGQVNETLAQADSAPVMLVSLLDAIVSEKRIQFSENSHAEIEVMLERGYGLFATINASELSRVISNLVNNAVESFSGVGRVTVKVASRDDKSLITVTDNGCGITSEILGRLGGRGVTQGKDGTLSGSGIGIFHARATIEAAGGEFLIESQVGIGTTVTLSLPKTAAPKWFVEKNYSDRRVDSGFS